MNNWKEERLKYTRCSSLNKPIVGDKLYYKYKKSKSNDYKMVLITLLEVCDNGVWVCFGNDYNIRFGIFDFKDFYILNENNEQL